MRHLMDLSSIKKATVWRLNMCLGPQLYKCLCFERPA
jgi:hypothetical protein